MKDLTVGIIFGGRSNEHGESIRATQILYRRAIKGQLELKYRFRYFYITKNGDWASGEDSRLIVQKKDSDRLRIVGDRLLDLKEVSVIYSTMMGPYGENGNIMGLADMLKVPIIGCGILASALALDKHLSKIVAEKIGIPTVDYIAVEKDDSVDEIVENIKTKINFPCFVKPTNLGTCGFIFKASDEDDFRRKWHKTIRDNKYSQHYLIEKFIPNIEVRVFIYEDEYGRLRTNDEYVTILKEKALDRGGVLFDHVNNQLSSQLRDKIKKDAIRLFKTFGMKDYARIDFFVDKAKPRYYFNEANTQPFLGGYNVDLIERDGLTYTDYFEMLITRNMDTR